MTKLSQGNPANRYATADFHITCLQYVIINISIYQCYLFVGVIEVPPQEQKRLSSSFNCSGCGAHRPGSDGQNLERGVVDPRLGESGNELDLPIAVGLPLVGGAAGHLFRPVSEELVFDIA
jgi:hypothetical protein